jgi:uncharacterized protein YqjF (DUF2071 family)
VRVRLVAEFVDLAIVTFDVDPHALARHLPADVRPDVFTLGTRGERALVSAVSFRACGVRWRTFPWPRLAYSQVNYRAYVRGPEGPAVWFFRMCLGSRPLAWSQALRGLPMEAAGIEVHAAWEGPRLLRYTLRQAGGGAAEMQATGVEAGVPDGFTSEAHAREVLTHPLLGYSHARGGRRARYVVDHARMTVVPAEATSARFALFEGLGLIEAGTRPHSVLVAARSEFEMAPPAVL